MGIKEWHFHVYWFATKNQSSRDEAEALRQALIAQVEADREFIAVFDGITRTHFSQLTTQPPPMNHGPIGPHVSGSFEVWAPKESFAKVLSWFTLNRGSLSILIHPLTRYELLDHTSRAMWLGQPWVIDLAPLSEDLGKAPAQYPELGLGYNGTVG